MRIVLHSQPPCPCAQIRDEFLRAQEARGVLFAVGSILECDCGRQYRLEEHQRDGVAWCWHHPDSSDMTLR